MRRGEFSGLGEKVKLKVSRSESLNVEWGDYRTDGTNAEMWTVFGQAAERQSWEAYDEAVLDARSYKGFVVVEACRRTG